ncbi:MAG: NADH:ubiquinone oxidoreductase subunit NDUFA12 [Pseudomonadota bacterium]
MRLIERVLELVTWWNGQTLGTRLYTARHGQRVGEDEYGNVFYQTADASRRWVIYNGESEASRISPDWHGWLHHTYDTPPSEQPFEVKTWEKAHKPNMSGTDFAYRPPGSVLTPEKRPPARGDYDAWQPE